MGVKKKKVIKRLPSAQEGGAIDKRYLDLKQIDGSAPIVDGIAPGSLLLQNRYINNEVARLERSALRKPSPEEIIAHNLEVLRKEAIKKEQAKVLAEYLQKHADDYKKPISRRQPKDNTALNTVKKRILEDQTKKVGLAPIMQAPIMDEEEQQFKEALRQSSEARKDAELARRKKVVEIADEAQKDSFFSSSRWTRKNLAGAAQGLGERFRIFEDDVGGFGEWIDEHVNPLMAIAKMAQKMGEAPLNAQRTNSTVPYLTAIGTPLLYRAIRSRPFESIVPFARNALAARTLNDHIQNIGKNVVVETGKDLAIDSFVDNAQALIDKSIEPKEPKKARYDQPPYASGGISTQGYKRNSPDRFNAYNLIPSNQITMKGVPHPVVGVDNTGAAQVMMPGVNYVFPGQEVLEVPLMNGEQGAVSSKRYQQGGTAPVIPPFTLETRMHEPRVVDTMLPQDSPVFQQKQALDTTIKNKEIQSRTPAQQAAYAKQYFTAQLIEAARKDRHRQEELNRREKVIEQSDAVQSDYSLFSPERWSRKNLSTLSQATPERFRFFPDDVGGAGDFVDSYINPFVWVGNMAKGLGEAPLQAQQTNSVLPYFKAVGAPLVAGALGANPLSTFTNPVKGALNSKGFAGQAKNIWDNVIKSNAIDVAKDKTIEAGKEALATWTAPTVPQPGFGFGGSYPWPGAQKRMQRGGSVVDYLTSVGEDASKAGRRRLATQLGIENYKGTAAQNLQLLELLQSGAAKANAQKDPTSEPAAPVAPMEPADPKDVHPTNGYVNLKDYGVELYNPDGTYSPKAIHFAEQVQAANPDTKVKFECNEYGCFAIANRASEGLTGRRLHGPAAWKNDGASIWKSKALQDYKIGSGQPLPDPQDYSIPQEVRSLPPWKYVGFNRKNNSKNGKAKSTDEANDSFDYADRRLYPEGHGYEHMGLSLGNGRILHGTGRTKGHPGYFVIDDMADNEISLPGYGPYAPVEVLSTDPNAQPAAPLYSGPAVKPGDQLRYTLRKNDKDTKLQREAKQDLVNYFNNADLDKRLMTATGISKEDLEGLKPVSLGVLGNESSFNDMSWLGATKEFIGDKFSDASLGPFQIKFKSIPQKVRDEFGIKSEKDLYSLEKSYPAAMSVLYQSLADTDKAVEEGKHPGLTAADRYFRAGYAYNMPSITKKGDERINKLWKKRYEDDAAKRLVYREGQQEEPLTVEDKDSYFDQKRLRFDTGSYPYKAMQHAYDLLTTVATPDELQKMVEEQAAAQRKIVPWPLASAPDVHDAAFMPPPFGKARALAAMAASRQPGPIASTPVPRSDQVPVYITSPFGPSLSAGNYPTKVVAPVRAAQAAQAAPFQRTPWSLVSAPARNAGFIGAPFGTMQAGGPVDGTQEQKDWMKRYLNGGLGKEGALAEQQARLKILDNTAIDYEDSQQNFNEDFYSKMINNDEIMNNINVRELMYTLKGDANEKKQRLIHLMNTVASRSNGNGSMIARYGGKVKYQDGGSLNYQAPEGYVPSTPEQRANWNQFLDYLESKGVAGSEDLDVRDKRLGLQYLNEYNKAYPKAQVLEPFVKNAQYENYLIRKEGSFPTLTKEEADYAFGNLSPAYKQAPISYIDGWPGSKTSKQRYPGFRSGQSINRVDGTQQVDSYNFGVNFEDYVRSKANPNLAQKYLVNNAASTTRKQLGGDYNAAGFLGQGNIDPFNANPYFTQVYAPPAAPAAAPAARPSFNDTGLYPYGVINPFDVDPFRSHSRIARGAAPATTSVPGQVPGFQNFMQNRQVLSKGNAFTTDSGPYEPEFDITKMGEIKGLRDFMKKKTILSKDNQNPFGMNPDTGPAPEEKTFWGPNIKGATNLVNDMAWLNNVLEAKDRNRYKDAVRIRSLADNKGVVSPGDTEDLRGDYSVNEGYFRPNRYVAVQNPAIPVAQLGGFCENGGACYQPPTQAPDSGLPNVTVPVTPVHTGDGKDIATRTNNPSNLKWHPWMSKLGGQNSGIPGKDGGTFAAFPSLQAGLQAYQTQLFGDTDGVFKSDHYKANTPIDKALKTWSNHGYGAEIYPEISNLTLGQITPAQRRELTRRQFQKESNEMFQKLSTAGVFQTGGEYIVTPDQLQFILAYGGEVEFL